MARLEIELAVVGSDKLKKGISEANSGLSVMQSILDKTKDSFSKANASALSLEKELNDLNKQLSSGAISSEKFAKEQSGIVTALSSSRQAAQAYQAQINNINATINRGVTSTDNYGNSVKKLAGYHSDYSKGIRGASGVSLEFARIIQDAPYGIQGVGNNIQQLTSNYQIYAKNLREAAAEQGKTISSFGIFKSAASGLLNPLSLITIGVSLATSAWTAYTMWSQKSAKADEEKAKSAKKVVDANELYLNSLGAIDKLRVKGDQNAQKEIVSLGLLYSATRNVNLPMSERFKAAKALQDQYPDTFKNFTQEQIALGKASIAYKELSKDILATARVAAATDIITENTRKLVLEQLKFNKATKELEKINKAIADAPAIETRAAGSAGTGASTAVDPRVKALNDLTAQQNKLQKDLIESQKTKTALVRENLSVEKLVTQEVKNQGVEVLATSGKGNGSKKVKTPVDRSDAIVARSEATADLSGLTGVDREVETIRQRYIKLYNDLSINAKKSADARKSFEVDLNKLQANEANEISTIIISEQQRVANEIQRINNESGVASNENRAKELAAVQKWYDAEILKARDSAEIIASIEEGKTARIDSINNKYEAKRIDQQTKLNDKIASLAGKDFTLNERFSNRITAKNKEPLNERLKDVEKHFEELRKLNATNPLALLALGVAEGGIKQDITGKANNANNAGSSAIFKDLASSLTDEIVGSLRNIRREADQTFGSVIGKLGTSLFEGLSSSVSDIFINDFKNQFSSAIKDASSQLSVGLKGAIAGAGLLGGAISGLTKKTSGAGQGIGGAISGAATGAGAAIATGAALGTAAGPIGIAIGAGIGGLVGLLGGIFGAKKARKEDAIQKAQLEEQKKQTALQERANALAYSASIIGQQTNQGVVTGVERDAAGNLVAKLAGKDILIVYERALADKKRGIA